MSPFVGILGPSAFSGRILNVLLGVGDIFLIFLLSQKFFRKKSISLVAAFILAVSPWHLLITRSAYDVPVALFFYLLAIAIFIYKAEKGNILWSVPAFLLAFYSYHATKIFFLLFIPLLILTYKDELLKRKKELYLFTVCALVIFASFLASMKINGEKRQESFFWNQSTYVEKAVDRVVFERNKSDGPVLAKKIFSNKAIFYARDMGVNYLSAYSPENLFLRGDYSRITDYTSYYLPLFQPLEIIFLLLGFIFLFKINKKTAIFIVASILIAPLPGVLVDPGDRSFIFRGVMLLPFFTLVISGGVIFALDMAKKMRFKKVILLLFVLLYSFLVVRSLYIYFFQFSTVGAESWFVSSREISEFIDHNKTSPKILIADRDKILPVQIALYEKTDPKVFQDFWKGDRTRFGNLYLLDDCSVRDPSTFLIRDEIYIYPANCNTAMKATSVIENSQNSDVIWKIYEKH
jgi:4-amino-4-deoxy-L-arabinose transferase-like glycosyltransferase